MLNSKDTFSTVKSILLGAAVGAAALAIIGFNWGGWVTGGTAEKLASLKASAAVAVALAPMCVDNFKRQADAGGQLVSFQKLPSYQQTDFVEKGGWAASLGAKDDNSAIARSCAESLAKLTAADLG